MDSAFCRCRSGLSFSEVIAGSTSRPLHKRQSQQQRPAPEGDRLYSPFAKTSSAKASPSLRKKRKDPFAPPRRRPSSLSLREAVLYSPLEELRISDRILRSPQLNLKTLPLMSSLLPSQLLRDEDHEWIEEFLPEVKEALGYPPHGTVNADNHNPHSNSFSSLKFEDPVVHLDTLLFLAFQHLENARGMAHKAVRVGHSRLCFLGQYVLELALAEYFLQRYPREQPACIRERVYALTKKSMLPKWFKSASLDGILFTNKDIISKSSDTRLRNIKSAFLALVAALYLVMGMREVYCLLFEVFGFNPDDKQFQPKQRLYYNDIDYVFNRLEESQISWQEVATIKTEEDSVFSKPLLYRACIPPGMKRFRTSLWEVDSLTEVLKVLGYPRTILNEDLNITQARNSELELGLQICFLHPSMYKQQHPRFCNERFEYLGSKIQDVVMAERLLMKHLDGPGFWLARKHRRLLFNRVCGKYFREKRLHHHLIISDARRSLFVRSRRLKNYATTAVSLALHGLAYTVYGKADVRRLMFEVLDFERENVNEPNEMQAAITFDQRIGGRLNFPSFS